MKKYCDKCRRDTETHIVTKKETYEVYGESYDVDAQVLVCNECGEELFCEKLDNDTLVAVYDKYRSKHKLLTPDQIKQIREQYGLSQRGFAKLLNWGDKTIRRYEDGSIQDKAHNSVLLFLKDPENMKSYLSENETSLSEKQKNKLLEIVDELKKGKRFQANKESLKSFFSKEPCEENGFKEFDYEKLCAMVLFFAKKDKGLLKTKLMKLLNYSDMIFYKENGVSISGLRYAHLPYGPVPDNFDILLGKIAVDHIAHIDVVYDSGYEKHQVVSEHDIPDDVLTEAEIEVLNRVQEKFHAFNSKEISDYSHKEKGYRETKTGDIISYSYAMDIEL